MDNSSIVEIIIGVLGMIGAIIGGIGGWRFIFQKRRKTKQTFAEQKSKGAINSPQIQAGGKVSIGETRGDIDKGK
jgi:hypothetical protein